MTTLAEKIAARRGTGQTLAEKMAQRQAEQSPVGDAVEQAATRARDVYGVAQTLRLPLATVEANYDRLQADLPPDLQTSSSVLRWVEQHGGTPPHNVLMPQPPIPAQQNQIGVIEQITRMDGLDWAGRLPFIGSFASSEIPIAALRLQADQYETEFQANMERLEGQTTSGRMEAMPSRTSAEQRRRTRLSQTPEQLRQRDIDLVTTYLLKQQEVAERGQTFGARVFDGASYLPAWMIEFALTGGLNKLGNETAKEIGLRTLQGYAKTSGGQAVLRAAGWTGGVITRTTLGMPTRIGEAILERRIQSMALDETGNVVIEINPESWGTSVLKGYMHTLIEVGTEEAGDSILRPVGAWIGRNTLGRLPFAKGLYDQMRRAYTALHPDATDFASRFFDAAKFDGLLAEMGEERLATILHAVVGTEDFGLGPDSGPLERLEAGLRQDLANLPVEAATLAIPGATAALARQRSVPNEIDRLARTMHQANDQVSVDDYKQRIEKLIQPDADPAEVTRKAAEELYRLDPSQTVEQWQAQLAPEEATDEPAEPVPPVAEEKTGQTPAIGEPVPDYKAFADGVEAEKIEPPVPTPDAMRKAAPTWLSHMVTPELAEQWARGEAGDQAVVDAALAFRKEPATGKRVSDELDIIENADGSRTVRSETMGRETNFGMASHQDAYNYAQEQALGELADARLEAQWATYQAASRVPGREPSITLQQITEAVANDNTEGLLADFEIDQPDPAAVHREFRTWARGRLPAVIRRKLRALGEAGIESPLDAAELTPENKERLAIEHAINMAYRLDESVTPTEPSAAEVKASLHEDAAAEATQALNAFFSQPDPSDVTPTEPTRQQMRGLKRLMKRLGLAKIEGYDVLSEKDYRDIFKYLQMPDDVRRTFPAFDKVYQVQKARETAKAVLDRVFAEKLKPYFDLPRKQQLEVDQLLVSAEQNRTDLKAILAKIDKKQHDAYKAVRESLDYAAELLVDKMVELGVNEEWINEFRSRIGYYIPHKWYGAWRIVAKDKITKKTVAMSGADRRDRQREADRLQSLYPDAKVTIIKASKLPFDAYQDVTFTGMVEMVDKVVEIANKKQGTEMTDDQAQILQDAWRQLWKEKGFGMHFIQRQETPGYTEDLRRPLAEYFTGFAGYLTKMEAGLKFPEALADIDGKRTPNLYKYASEYIRYVMGDEAYWGRFKTLMYYKYLYGNAKSAAVNLSANLMLGWPELAKVTRFSLPKILWSQARYATRQLSAHQNAFLEAYRKAGHSDAKLAAEISAFGSNAVFMASIRGAKKLLTWADLFRHAETFNRESMALALYDVGYAEGENDRLTKIAETVEAAHFRYSKGNRPTLWRGRAGAALTFRSYTVNYLTWMKNQVKEKQWGPLARSLAVWTLIGGLKATPWGALAAGLYRRVVKRDPEDDLEEAVGEHIAKTVMRGAPSQVGVSLTGSVAMLDLLPELRQGQDWRIGLTKWMAGVGGSVADQAENVVHDLQTGQYGRALEDAAPEVLRNPLAAYRMSQGARTRAGAPLIDVTTREPLKLTGPEAVLKGFGFQPDRINRGYEQMRLAEGMQAARRDTLKHWAERFNLALLNGDEQARAQILLEVADYNRQIETRKQWDLRIEPAELLSRVRALQRPANLPTERELETYLRLYGVPEEKE